MAKGKSRKVRRAYSETVPGVVVAESSKREDIDVSGDTLQVPPKTDGNTAPPGSLETSAGTEGMPSKAKTAGALKLERQCLPEAVAREVIGECFAKAGYALASDYPFSHQNLMIRLDGFDPSKNIGYQYLSHQDEDVVSDFDASIEKQLEELARNNIARVLVVHDYAATTKEALVETANAFLKNSNQSD